MGTPGRQRGQVEPRRWKARQTRVDDELSCAASRPITILAPVFMTGMRLERMLLT